MKTDLCCLLNSYCWCECGWKICKYHVEEKLGPNDQPAAWMVMNLMELHNWYPCCKEKQFSVCWDKRTFRYV